MYNYKLIRNMKKNYNIPATEVVAFVSGMVMQTASPNPTPQPGQDIPGENV